jgi:hypothetical protein
MIRERVGGILYDSDCNVVYIGFVWVILYDVLWFKIAVEYTYN